MKSLIWILAALACFGSGEARTLIVAADSSAEFVHIGDAADSAQFGDTVLVRDGLYEGWDPTAGEEIIADSGVVVVAEHPGHVAVTVAPNGIQLHGTAKLMNFNLATNPIAHAVYLVSILGGPATLDNCQFHSASPNSMGAQVIIQSNGRPPLIQACDFQFRAPIFMIINNDSTNVWMPGNYFDVTDTTWIHLQIYDGYRNPSIGFVYVSPVSDSFQWLGVDDHRSVAASVSSLRAFPNPFNSVTRIAYNIPRMGTVKLRVFDVSGREAATLVDGTFNPGAYSVQWNAENYPSGMYFTVLQAGGKRMVQKMVLIR